MPFQDRIDAGRKLALALKGYRTNNMIILALPRGGVPIGYEIATVLEVPLDVLIVRKLGTRGHKELAMGAIAPGGIIIRNEDIIQMMSISQTAMDQAIVQETEELNRRMHKFRGDRLFPELTGKTVVIVDDGLATGATAMAAVQTVQAMRPQKLYLAIPVCARDSATLLCETLDHLICLETPQDFMAVGCWYKTFPQTSDKEVIEILDKAWTKREVIF